MRRHLILVGLPGAGKSSVGRRAALLLHAEWSDTDDLVVLSAGRSIPEIFGRSGEAGFRRLERAAMDEALARPAQVIAAGAGWISHQGNLAAARGACLVYLKISPEAAAGRLSGDQSRPLLAGGDREARIRTLFEARERWYRMAEHEVDAGPDLEAVAAAVAAIARRHAGW